MDTTTLAVIAVFCLAALVRGLLGFGNALVAMPLLALFLSLEVATPLVALLSFSKAILMLALMWRQVCLKSAWRMLLAAAVGTPLGLLFLKGAHETVVQCVLAIVILLFSAYNIFHPHLIRLKSDNGAFVAGLLAGILGGAYNANGPPIVMYGSMRGWPPERFRATLQGFFFPAGVFILIGHASAGLWTWTVFRYCLFSLPPVITVLLVSRRFAAKIPPGRFDKLVHTFLVAIALLLLAKALS